MFANITDVIDKSVTKGDVEGQYRAGSPGSVFHFFFPYSGDYGYGLLPPEPPIYWTRERDRLLRSTVLKGGFWADAVSIAGTKQAAKSWEMEAENKPQLVKRCQELMLSLDAKGYVQGVQRGVRDFLTTDNGEFWEIVRASTAAGSRILGLMHLDSCRVIRTGDDEIPINYMDLRGRWHELRQHEVIMMCDMPSPSAELFGVGFCAASRAYLDIFKMWAISTYLNEKITGNNPNEVHLVNGVSEKTMQTAIQSADAQNTQKGYQIYKGVVIVPVYSENAVTGYRIQVSGIPDKFDRKQETDLAILNFADAIGLDLQDLQPLSGQGLGTGAQSYVQMEKAKGKGLAARDKDFVQQVNDKVTPDTVTFYFREVDLTDEQKKADVSAKRAEVRATMIANGEINAIESRALAVDSDDLPQEFKPKMEDDLNDTLNDEEKPETESEEQEAQAINTEVDPNAVQPNAQAQQPAQAQPNQTQPVASKEHIEAIVKLAKAIENAKR